jgi:hypothetical protein
VPDLSPPRPYATGGGGAGGRGFAPPNVQKKAEFYAQTSGVPLPVALDIVRNEPICQRLMSASSSLSD